ncbi:hypothetical protein JEZ48_16875 [Pseudomonas aeruginosa]|nr:hypothetical protein [Pseudomonas aeruginosa]
MQVVGQIRDALLEVFTLGAQVEAGFFVKFFEASLHRIRALQVTSLIICLNDLAAMGPPSVVIAWWLYGGVVWTVLSLCPAGLGHLAA